MKIRNPIVAFVVGFLLALFLGAIARPVEAQVAVIAFGVSAGTPTPLVVDASGNLSVQLQ